MRTVNGVDLLKLGELVAELRHAVSTQDLTMDKARLDFLEQSPATSGRLASGVWSVQHGILEVGRGPTLRAAIDAAMQDTVPPVPPVPLVPLSGGEAERTR